MKKKNLCTGLIAASAVLAMTGCSSSSDNKSTTAEATKATKAEESTKGDETTVADTTVADTTEVAETTEAPEETKGDTPEAPDMETSPYHAYLFFQTPAYSFRNVCDEGSYGLKSEYGDIYGTVHAWEDNNMVDAAGSFTDTGVTGDGTYTVKVSGLAFTADEFANNSNGYNMLGISTDIPVDVIDAMEDFQITIDELKIGDKVIDCKDVIANIDDETYCNYSTTKLGEEISTGLSVTIQNTYGDNDNIGAYDVTASDISITFTISGMGDYSESNVIDAEVDEPVEEDVNYTAVSVGKNFDYAGFESDKLEVEFTLKGFDGVETTAQIAYAGAGWAGSDWASNVAVNGDGTYTLVADVQGEDGPVEKVTGAVVFCVDIKVAEEGIKMADYNYEVSDVKVNGEAVNFIYGDTEDKGNVRIEIYNEYGPTNGYEFEAPKYVVDASADKAFDFAGYESDKLEVEFTLAGFDGVETTAQIAYAGAGWAGSDWASNVAVNGDGTYTLVADVQGEDGPVEKVTGAVVFCIDINVSDEAISITDTDYVVSDVKVNGEAVNFIYGDTEDKGNVRIEIYNEYGPTNGLF